MDPRSPLASFPPAPPIVGERVELRPLRVGDAEEMAAVLADEQLYRYTGGRPPTVQELRAQYASWVGGGSGDGRERWLNWVVVLRDGGAPAGHVQATVTVTVTVTQDRPALQAEVAWVVGAPWQGRGLAVDAAGLMANWLRDKGVAVLVAHVHPDHRASAAIAHRIGLAPTGTMEDGEERWSSAGAPVRPRRPGR